MTGVIKHNASNTPLKKVCPKCGKDVLLYTHYRAMSVGCVHCNNISFFDANQNLHSPTKTKLNSKLKVLFNIGDVFTIENIKYRLINYIIKRETKYSTSWIEYTLFHPTEGTLVLNESDGHFNLLKPIDYFQENKKTSFLYSVDSIPTKFSLYSKYKYKVVEAQGEFLYGVLNNYNPSCEDYVSPPYVLSCEQSASEVIWFLGEYCSHAEVQSWLSKTVALPSTEGVAPNQPYATKYNYDSFIKLTGLAVVFLILFQLLYSGFYTAHRAVSQNRFDQSDSLATRALVSPNFDIKQSGAADFIINSFLDNNWIEANFTLINETTGEQYYFGQALEHYSGYEDGYAWSEGSNTETVTVPEISAGTYHYNIEITNDSVKRFQVLHVEVIEGVSLMSNFWITLLLILVVPVITWLLKSNFDRRRWYNSDYSPYDEE